MAVNEGIPVAMKGTCTSHSSLYISLLLHMKRSRESKAPLTTGLIHKRRHARMEKFVCRREIKGVVQPVALNPFFYLSRVR